VEIPLDDAKTWANAIAVHPLGDGRFTVTVWHPALTTHAVWDNRRAPSFCEVVSFETTLNSESRHERPGSYGAL
jgi:hypothetical protein